MQESFQVVTVYCSNRYIYNLPLSHLHTTSPTPVPNKLWTLSTMFTYLLTCLSLPLYPSVPAVTGCLGASAVDPAFDLGEEPTVSWVVWIKVTASSDLWLFIHASSLLPSLPTPLPCIPTHHCLYINSQINAHTPTNTVTPTPTLKISHYLPISSIHMCACACTRAHTHVHTHTHILSIFSIIPSQSKLTTIKTISLLSWQSSYKYIYYQLSVLIMILIQS